VLHSGDEIDLPAVRARHIPMLAAISAGRLPTPLAEPADPPPKKR
jgi:hypothetical protein